MHHFSFIMSQTSTTLISPILRGDYYLDPGSGSFILQLLLATLLGLLFLLKTYWNKITTFIKSLFSKNKKKTEEEE